MGFDRHLIDRLIYGTVRIECETSDGCIGTGTGFVFNVVDDGEKLVPAIVTNKHVLEGGIRGEINMHLWDHENRRPEIGRYAKFMIEDFDKRWIPHPDEDIDLAIMPLSPFISAAESKEQLLYYTVLGTDVIPSDDKLSALSAMEEVVMIGYPNGIWDEIHNLPIVRRGITATSPAIDYNGRPNFMIDAACFPGSSGSPVIFMGDKTVYLLGILYAGPQFSAEGDIEIVNVPTVRQAISITSMPMNLGLVIKSKKLLDFGPVLADLDWSSWASSRIKGYFEL